MFILIRFVFGCGKIQIERYTLMYHIICSILVIDIHSKFWEVQDFYVLSRRTTCNWKKTFNFENVLRVSPTNGAASLHKTLCHMDVLSTRCLNIQNNHGMINMSKLNINKRFVVSLFLLDTPINAMWWNMIPSYYVLPTKSRSI